MSDDGEVMDTTNLKEGSNIEVFQLYTCEKNSVWSSPKGLDSATSHTLPMPRQTMMLTSSRHEVTAGMQPETRSSHRGAVRVACTCSRCEGRPRGMLCPHPSHNVVNFPTPGPRAGRIVDGLQLSQVIETFRNISSAGILLRLIGVTI